MALNIDRPNIEHDGTSIISIGVAKQPCVLNRYQLHVSLRLPYFFPACLSTRKGGHFAFCLDLVKL